MNWKLIFALSLFGLVIAVGSLFGLGLLEFFLWPIIFAINVWLIAIRAPGKYFLHGFLANVFSAGWMTLVHAYYLFDVARHNFVEVLPRGINPQVMNLMEGAVIGAVTGAITGLFALLAAKSLKNSTAPEAKTIR